VAAAVSSDWSAKNRIAVCRIAKIKATNGAAKRPNSTVVDALRCETKRRGSGDLSSRTARAEIFDFSCSNMSPSPSEARASARAQCASITRQLLAIGCSECR
jgi:hypothetical protein